MAWFHSARARDLLDRFPIVGRLTEKPRTQPIIAEVGEGGALCNFTVYDPAKKHVVYAVGRDRRVPLHVDEIHEEFRAWVKGDDTFPCIAGKTAVIGYSSYGLGVYDGPIGDQANTEALLHDLRTFIRYQSAEWAAGNRFTTFIAVFPESIGEDKWDDFQKKLRAQLVALQQADNTSKDGMSDLKRDFLVVGLHPAADRKAHRFAYPALVFNSKDQFKYLETTGQMGPIQNAVRRRDKQISGGELVNPLLPQVKLSVPNGG